MLLGEANSCENGPHKHFSSLLHMELCCLWPKWFGMWKCGQGAPMSVSPNIIYNISTKIARCHRSWKISWWIPLLKVQRSDTHVMSSVMIFSWITYQVLLHCMPYNSVLFFVNLIARVEIPHFHQTSLVAFDGTIDNTNGGFIVAVDGSWWLWMAKFL